MKSSVRDLAIFGGVKLFDSPRPVGQLDAPPVEDFLRLVKSAFDARYLTNGGQLMQTLEEKLCEYHAVGNCVTVANAALGLTMLMQLFAKERAGEVIMPAFSYRGLPHFARWAGQMPRFCDVDPTTHVLSPSSVEAALSEKTTSILSVCNFNSPGDIDRITAIADKNGIPFLLDSVYGQGASYHGKPLGGFGDAEVFSTHATKLLNGFEGGYVTTDDNALAEALRRQRNFGLPGMRPEPGLKFGYALGVNAKLNELHAAMALLSLERLDDVIERNRQRFQAYAQAVANIPGISIVPCESTRDERRNFQLAVLDISAEWSLSRDQTLSVLKAEGAAVSAYYSPALHRSEHCPPGLEVAEIPVAESLARRYCQLPVGEMVTLEDIGEINDLLLFLMRNGEEVAARLSSNGSH